MEGRRDEGKRDEGMKGRNDEEKEEFRSRKIQDRDSGLEGFRTRGIQERSDTGKKGSIQEGFIKGEMLDNR